MPSKDEGNRSADCAIHSARQPFFGMDELKEVPRELERKLDSVPDSQEDPLPEVPGKKREEVPNNEPDPFCFPAENIPVGERHFRVLL